MLPGIVIPYCGKYCELGACAAKKRVRNKKPRRGKSRVAAAKEWSRLISRILSWVVIYLGRPLPTASCGTPGCLRRAAVSRLGREHPYRPLLHVGFSRPTCRHAAGALLPHHFTLTRASLSRRKARGAVSFLLHYPSGHPASPLASTLPCGVRTFLPDTLEATTWPTPTPLYLISTLPRVMRTTGERNPTRARWKRRARCRNIPLQAVDRHRTVDTRDAEHRRPRAWPRWGKWDRAPPD